MYRKRNLFAALIVASLGMTMALAVAPSVGASTSIPGETCSEDPWVCEGHEDAGSPSNPSSRVDASGDEDPVCTSSDPNGPSFSVDVNCDGSNEIDV